MKLSKRALSAVMAVSVAALNISVVPFNATKDLFTMSAYAESVNDLEDGEYSVTLNFDCYESAKNAVYNQYFLIDKAKVVVSTDTETGERKYSLKLPVDYNKRINFSYTKLFGYSYTKYMSDAVADADISAQDGFINKAITASELYAIDDTTSAFSYIYDIDLNNLEDEVYIYFSYKSSFERLSLTLSDIGEETTKKYITPSITNIIFSSANTESGLYYQDRTITSEINYEHSGNVEKYVCEYMIDDGNGYSDTFTMESVTLDPFRIGLLGDLKLSDFKYTPTNVNYYITNHDAHSLKMKLRVGAKYSDIDQIFWSDYKEGSINIAKAGINAVYSDDEIDDFTNDVKPRLFASSNYVIPYDAKLSISKVSDSNSLGNIEQLLKNETGRESVDFSALNIQLLNADGNTLEEIISPEWSSWSQFTARSFILPSIKEFDLNNIGVYRFENGKLIEQGTGNFVKLKTLDTDTNQNCFCFQPDANGPSGTYVFIQKDYCDITEAIKNTYKNNWFTFEAHLFDTTDNLKFVAYDSLIDNNTVYSYYSDDDACIYVNLTDISGEYADDIKYKPAGSDSYTEAEVIETIEKDSKTYPSVIRIPMTSTSAYIPLCFTFGGDTKEVNLGISYKSADGAMVSKPAFTAPSITVKNADGNGVVNFTNDGVAYVSIDAPENGQKLLYTLTADNEVIAENQQYTEPLELKAQSDDDTVYTLKTWVEAANADAASSLANSAVVSEEISFSAKGSYAETAKTPVIGVQYKSGDSLDDATFKVTITSETDGATIYYTVDGSDPTTESAVYNEPFTVNGLTDGNATVIKALAVKENANDSETVQKTVAFKTGWWDNLLPNSEYSIPVNMVHFLDPTKLSMGDSAIDGNATFKVDANGNKTLTIPFHPIDVGGTNGYVIHYWYFPDESKAYTTAWKTYMLDHECDYTFNIDGTIKTVTLPINNDEELIPAALEANVDIMGKQRLFIQPDYSSIIEEITGEKQEKDAVDKPEINTILSTYGSRIDTTFSMPESSEYSDADIYYIISTDENLTWDDSKATKYDPSKPITITVADTDANGMTNIYAVAKYGDKQSIVSTKKIMFDTEKAPKLEGYVGVLSDYVGLAFQFKMNSELVAGNPIAQLEVAGQTSNAKIEVLSTDSSGVSTCRFIAKLDAKQMTDVVTANIIVGDETVATFTGCVKDYADTIIANENGEYSDKAIAAAKALLNYGGYSQVLFDYNTDNLANASIDSNVSSVTADSLTDYLPKKTGSDDTAKFTGYNLYLDSLTRMRFWYTGDVTASANAENFTTGESGGKKYVEISGITPANLVNGYDITVGTLTLHFPSPPMRICRMQ